MRIETDQVLSALRNTVRRAGVTVSPKRACRAGRALISVADVALAQLGVPGTLGCCEYLIRRWRNCLHRSTSGKNTSTHPGHTVPVSGTDALDHKRS